MKHELSPEEVSSAVAAGELLVDVRNPDEFASGHIEGARLIPQSELGNRWREIEGQPLILMCQSGSRSELARVQLESLGFPHLRTLKGGILAWKQANLPVKRTSAVMPLERQVRIAAGSLVLLGVLLSWMLHPVWIALSAFVGAGLVFAGVTDTCGMGMLLMKMPWNKISSTASGSCGVSQNRV